MIVKLTDKERDEIAYQADYNHNRLWSAISDSLVELDDEDNEYGVDEGPDNEIAEEVMDAFWEAQETDQREGGVEVYPTRDDSPGRVGTRLSIVGQSIVRHMDFGLAYGFNDDDWER
jgi:hypothetical protein